MSLLIFTGTDCPHCEAMRPLVARLAFDTGISVEERDTWKNEADYRLLENYQEALGDPDCVGIPFFYNTESRAFLCGEVSYKELKAWAQE